MMRSKRQLLSVGAWAPFDHLFHVQRLPEKGQTVAVRSGAEVNGWYYGDCSINVAYIAAKLGVSTALATIVGHDFASSGYERHLQQAGIDLQGVVVKESQPSGRNYLIFDDEGDAICYSHLGAGEDQEQERVPDHLIADCTHLIISEQFSRYTLEALCAGKRAGARTYVNGMIETAGGALEHFLQATDVLFINESEYERLLRRMNGDRERMFSRSGLSMIFITLGKRGCRVLSADREEVIPLPFVADQLVKDTTGAGDAFAAGVISALIKGYPVTAAARIGATVSSFVIEEWGSQTGAPDWSQVCARYEARYQEAL